MIPESIVFKLLNELIFQFSSVKHFEYLQFQALFSFQNI